MSPYCKTQRILSESMKLLAFGLVLLSCLQSFATSDYQALYEMRMQLSDDGGVLKDWKDNQMTPCNWTNIDCQDNKVIAITLSSKGLVGILSPSIAKITTLQQLLLDGNAISGRIPEELGNLSSLTTLNLGRNLFNGSIPNSLGRLLKLQNLDLSENTLAGTIPISLSNLSSLNNINLSDNDLSGEIPEKLLQVAQYNYTGNHLNCSRQSTPCEKRTAKTGPKIKSNVWILVVVSSLLGVALCIIFCFGPIVFRSLSKGKQRVKDRSNVIMHRDVELVWGTEGNNPDFTFFNYSQVLDATNDFSVENKLGQGGFGPVYKGRLPDGLEIAVKRLASHSMQGFREFRNEVQLIAKLQHRNLVRLLGYCSHGEEKMLVYEYLKNKSLDFFIFDEKRRTLLNWDKRLVIIEGIAQGLLYLHKHSRLRVIHRDVKASNILLDYEMNPKISDFGMAKMFSSNDNEGNTERVVGTYGYMAPEYASEGLFSGKSDVFSFGVLILEIITGERNSGFYYHGNFLNLLGYAWKLWKKQRWPELVDISLATNGCTLEMMRCINIALLCVQENAIDRPTTSDVVAMLGSEDMVLPEPKHPGYFHARVAKEEASTIAETYSINDATMSSTHGR
ncbi:LRR receptor kinase SERK2-like isoform X3 [Miscanthus floridulus]|uniref:LRR receptor kinase SERK2-like isoform X3 n=2 Tax=Miscanthus floridulus TaxID=154761 RepID=UPI00345953D7